MFRSEDVRIPSRERCLRALADRDARFDGWFYTAVSSTGIYCRPSCPARTPKERNVSFFASAAAAQAAGFRACKRCRPDAAPGSPEWDLRADAVGRAMRLIADGVVDREGVSGLAERLGFSQRHVHRIFTEAVGAGPLAIARAARAQNARVLLETTPLPIADVAFAAGFSSVRQFNETMRAIFDAAPRQLRAGRRGDAPVVAAGLHLRLPTRTPFSFAALRDFLGARAVAGVEAIDDQSYVRTLTLAHGSGTVRLSAAQDSGVYAIFDLEDLRDLASAIERVRRLCDLDADPQATDTRLAEDRLLRMAVKRRPGMRVPGTVHGHELAVRAVLGQQVSVRRARTLAERLVELCGRPSARSGGSVARLFPTAAAVAALDPATLPMPLSRARALTALAGELAEGTIRLDGSQDRAEVRERLLAVRGIGEWTTQYIAMRALRDPDAFLAGDVGARRGLEALGRDGSPHAALAAAERWRPYRACGLQHLWAIAAESEPPRRKEPR